jgi:hypothetical protein
MMSFHGSTQVTDVLDVMQHACYTDDVTHIIIDNLQFMLSGQAAGLQRFQLQEETVAHLRKFATDHACHVSLVVHPRKEDDAAPLSVSSIFGSAKVTQEADNVVILQNSFDGKPKYLDVLKNRFSGDLGHVPLAFNKDELRFYDLSGRVGSGDQQTEAALGVHEAEAAPCILPRGVVTSGVDTAITPAVDAAAAVQQVHLTALPTVGRHQLLPGGGGGGDGGHGSGQDAATIAAAADTVSRDKFQLFACERPRNLSD